MIVTYFVCCERWTAQIDEILFRMKNICVVGCTLLKFTLYLCNWRIHIILKEDWRIIMYWFKTYVIRNNDLSQLWMRPSVWLACYPQWANWSHMSYGGPLHCIYVGKLHLIRHSCRNNHFKWSWLVAAQHQQAAQPTPTVLWIHLLYR